MGSCVPTRSSDVFVLPSFYEGLPLVTIEALACGCKVVATDLPGVRPWMEAMLPGAPVTWVASPRMTDVDTPVAADLRCLSAHWQMLSRRRLRRRLRRSSRRRSLGKRAWGVYLKLLICWKGVRMADDQIKLTSMTAASG